MSLRPDGSKWPVAILGATGAVGQTFVRLLEDHPWFEIAELCASERSAGKSYVDAAHWLEGAMPAAVRDLRVLPCDPSSVRSPIVFSALDAATAHDVEPAFAHAGRMVLSNAKSYRMDPDVPLVVPDVNPAHLDLVPGQRESRGWTGAIITNANFAAAVAAMALGPLHAAFGVRTIFAATMQATSGAGYPGVASLDILSNVIPYIADEEPKIEAELRKILGTRDGSRVIEAPIAVSTHANRVPVEHGHTVCMSIGFEKKPSAADVDELLRSWRGEAEVRGMPSAPERPIVMSDRPDRPQPRRDVNTGKGMSAVVGRVRPDPVLDVRLVVLGHNVVLGAAGASVLNAELLASRGVLAGPAHAR